MDKFQEVVTQRLEEIIERIKEHRLDSIDRDEAIERKLTNKIGNFVKCYVLDRNKKQTEDRMDIMTKENAKMKSYVIQMCDMIRATTQEKVDTEVQKVSEIFNKVKDEMVQRCESILQRNKKTISNIK